MLVIVIVSVPASVVNVIPVPAAKVSVSLASDADINPVAESCPDIAIVVKLFDVPAIAAMVVTSVIGSVVIVIFDPATNVS